MNFGAAFGKLVKRKRGVEGLTQQSLAEIAFDDAGQKTRISELENGHVAQPQAKTVDALVVALDIADWELNEVLNASPHPTFVDTMYDFFEDPGSSSIYIEVAANKEGKVILFHSGELKYELKRAEYFCEDKQLVLLSNDGRRRPCGMKIADIIAEQIEKGLGVNLVKIDLKNDNATTEEFCLPIKIVR